MVDIVFSACVVCIQACWLMFIFTHSAILTVKSLKTFDCCFSPPICCPIKEYLHLFSFQKGHRLYCNTALFLPKYVSSRDHVLRADTAICTETERKPAVFPFFPPHIIKSFMVHFCSWFKCLLFLLQWWILSVKKSKIAVVEEFRQWIPNWSEILGNSCNNIPCFHSEVFSNAAAQGFKASRFQIKDLSEQNVS